MVFSYGVVHYGAFGEVMIDWADVKAQAIWGAYIDADMALVIPAIVAALRAEREAAKPDIPRNICVNCWRRYVDHSGINHLCPEGTASFENPKQTNYRKSKPPQQELSNG